MGVTPDPTYFPRAGCGGAGSGREIRVYRAKALRGLIMIAVKAPMLVWIKNASNTGYEAQGKRQHSILRHGSRFRLADGSAKEPIGTLAEMKKLAQATEQQLTELAEEDAIAANHEAAPKPTMIPGEIEAKFVDRNPESWKVSDGDDSSDPAPSAHTAERVYKTGATVKKSSRDSQVDAPKTNRGVADFLRSQASIQPPHLMIIARAGTGKTTTLIGGLQIVRGEIPMDAQGNPLTPSSQQQEIWNSIGLSKGVYSIGFAAFNTSIVDELRRRVPSGVDVSTIHSLGLKALNRASSSRINVVGDRVDEILKELHGCVTIWDLRTKLHPVVVSAVKKLVGLCKVNLVELDAQPETDIRKLVDHYDVEISETDLRGRPTKSHWATIWPLVERVMTECRNNLNNGRIDFNDMIWLPIVLGLSFKQYDLLMVDEFQDLNRCQQEVVIRSGRRLIMCGDDRQAIYGFAGADATSIPRMIERLRKTRLEPKWVEERNDGTIYDQSDELIPTGCQVLSLTVTRRCGKAIVREANRLVKDFQAHESNGEGTVKSALYPLRRDGNRLPVEQTYLPLVSPGDMILCRTNAPLVRQCLQLIKLGLRARVARGNKDNDFGQKLISLITKQKKETTTELLIELGKWKDAVIQSESVKESPNESKIIDTQDLYDCVEVLCEDRLLTREVINRIEGIFEDRPDNKTVTLSSIHRSKGLEARRVFLLQLDKDCVPHPRCKGGWQLEQEHNLHYVAITRAINELVIVNQS